MGLANNRELEEVGNGSPRWVMLYVAGIDACYGHVKDCRLRKLGEAVTTWPDGDDWIV